MKLEAVIGLVVQGKRGKAGDTFECSCSTTSSHFVAHGWAVEASAPAKKTKKAKKAKPEEPATPE